MVAERDPYAFARLVLDYARALIWPAAVVTAILLFHGEVRQILTEREWEMFGVRVGARIQQISANVRGELDEIRMLLAELQQASPQDRARVAEEVETRIASLERNLGREFRQIQEIETAPAERPLPPSRPPTVAPVAVGRETAARWEGRGFEQLVQRQVGPAIESFTRAHELWPDYHNVAEIRRLLVRQQEALADSGSPAWRELYEIILTRYSWGMPDHVRRMMREETR